MSESKPQEPGCPCDRIEFPPKPDIPAGLTALPRQLAGFPEFRLAMLGLIRSHRLLSDPPGASPLTGWRAREGEDLGVMLLEMWAYVLDVLGFYDERIADESYLRTAVRGESLRRLVELIGYHPRPALAARVTLALLAEDGNGAVAVPPGVAFRSGPFGAESPQVFETGTPAIIDPRRNEWTLAPIRDDSLDSGVFFMDPGEAAVERGDLVLIRWGSAASEMAGARVEAVSSVPALDGETYVTIDLEPTPSLGPNAKPGETEVLKPALSAAVVMAISYFADEEILNAVRLDSVQREVEVGQTILITRGSLLHEAVVLYTGEAEVPQNPEAFEPHDIAPPTIPFTVILFDPPIDESWQNRRLNVHFGFVEAGRLTRPAKHRVALTDIEPMAAFEDISEPLEPDAQPNEVLLLGDDGLGARLAGTAKVDETGAGLLDPAQNAVEFPGPLRTPVRVFGNLIEATRGESVVNEVLGSGDASLPFQRFALAKQPLTYLNDPSVPMGRRSTLEIRVNGLLWREAPGFFKIGPEEEVYIVRQNPETGGSVVTFGDGETGARLLTGVGNVVASYRFGAGAAAPPANSITQLARPVPGVRAAENPVPAGGGADGDRPKDLRRNAPDSALLLGRAVSLHDFEALARGFGVINARADWTWDQTTQRTAVKIWFIPNNDAIAGTNERELKATLLGQADPNTPLVARQAEPVPAKLVVDLIVDARHQSDDVELAVAESLADPGSGLLALENIPIGCPLFRSAIFEQILSINGVESVRAMTFDGEPFGAWRESGEGSYFNFLPQLTVGNTAAGDALFAESQSGNTTNLGAFTEFVPPPTEPDSDDRIDLLESDVQL